VWEGRTLPSRGQSADCHVVQGKMGEKIRTEIYVLQNEQKNSIIKEKIFYQSHILWEHWVNTTRGLQSKKALSYSLFISVFL